VAPQWNTATNVLKESSLPSPNVLITFMLYLIMLSVTGKIQCHMTILHSGGKL
jgi:hypothetical protein